MKFSNLALGFAFLFSAFSVSAQEDKKYVDETVLKDQIEGAISFIASDELRGRDTPSPELDITAKYLSTSLFAAGVKQVPGMDSYFQDVKMVSSSPPESGGFTVGKSEYSVSNEVIYIGGKPIETNAPVVYAGFGTENDYADLDVKGKIVIVQSGKEGEPGAMAAFKTAGEKRQIAEDKGAIAMVELFNAPQPNWKILRYYMASERIELDYGGRDAGSIPHLWLEDVSNKKRTFFQSYTGNADLTLVGNDVNAFITKNVIGFVEGIDPKLKDEIIIYSAHYDHIGVGDADMQGDSIYNGTRDNAVGTVTVLEAAKNIAKYPLKRSAMFIFFTGEEKGLLGSEWYVEHPVMPLKDVVYLFNSDNAGYNDTTAATIIGLERTTAGKEITAACAEYGLRTTEDPVPEQNLFDRSDQVSFAKKGVPALMYTMGIKDFGEDILKYYHRQGDNPDSVDYNYLFKFAKAYVLACRMVGNMDERPYWIEGDKYFEAGEDLYRD